MPPNRGRRAALGAACAAGLVAALAGCGFHLRGSTDLAWARLAVPGSGDLAVALRRRIAATTSTRIVDQPGQAQAVLTVLAESQSQVPMAYNADGTVAQYQLVESATYQLTDAAGAVLIPPTSLSQTSNLGYSTSQTLAKANESDLLYRGMRSDLIDRILFRLQAVKPAPGASAAAAASAPR